MDYLQPLGDKNWTPAKAAPAEPKSLAEVQNLDYLANVYKYRAMCLVRASLFSSCAIC
mgnify:CR=1 FL=1